MIQNKNIYSEPREISVALRRGLLRINNNNIIYTRKLIGDISYLASYRLCRPVLSAGATGEINDS